jgi:Bacterial TniB protein
LKNQVAQLNQVKSATRELISKSDEERIAAIYRLAYIPYPNAEEILNSFEWMFTQPTCGRPRGLLLSAPSGNGKTTIINTFLYRHPVRSTYDVEIVPVLTVEAPPIPNEKRFLGQILRGFVRLLSVDELEPISCQRARGLVTTTALETGDAEFRFNRVKILVKSCRVKLMFVDEIHNLLAGSARQTSACCNLLKFIANELGIRIVLVGTERAENVLRSDRQLISRFPIVRLPLWHDGNKYRSFLHTLEPELRLMHDSNLASDEKALFLLQQSEGVLGQVVMAVKDAAVLAIKDGGERITMDHLKNSVFVPKVR